MDKKTLIVHKNTGCPKSKCQKVNKFCSKLNGFLGYSMTLDMFKTSCFVRLIIGLFVIFLTDKPSADMMF